jgi:hypothetical protein
VFVQFCSVLYFLEFGFVWKTTKPPVKFVDVSGIIILKWILKKCDGKQWIGFVYLKVGPAVAVMSWVMKYRLL